MRSSTDIQIEYHKRAVKEPYAAGEIKFQMSVGQRSGRCFYTDWIDTELGAGRHELSFYIIDELGFDEEPLQRERILMGDPQVFQQSTYIPATPTVKRGAFLEPETGRFQLGLQLVNGKKRNYRIRNRILQKRNLFILRIRLNICDRA